MIVRCLSQVEEQGPELADTDYGDTGRFISGKLPAFPAVQYVAKLLYPLHRSPSLCGAKPDESASPIAPPSVWSADQKWRTGSEVSNAPAAQPEGLVHVGSQDEASRAADPSSLARSALRRQTREVGANGHSYRDPGGIADNGPVDSGATGIPRARAPVSCKSGVPSFLCRRSVPPRWFASMVLRSRFSGSVARIRCKDVDSGRRTGVLRRSVHSQARARPPTMRTSAFPLLFVRVRYRARCASAF
jgi:hypothetical protein